MGVYVDDVIIMVENKKDIKITNSKLIEKEEKTD